MAKQTIPPFFFLFFFFYCSNQLQISQYEALVRIKEQLNLPQEISMWNENLDLCTSEPTQFLSLACYDENITQLHITGNYWFPRLSQHLSTASLFSDIANLPNLKVLSLVSVGLKGPLPSSIADLASLEILNMSCNSLDGPIPRQISLLKNLQTLILDHNSLQGEIPSWIGSLPVLRVLSLKNNSIAGSLPNSMSRMINLRILVLSGNNLSGEVDIHKLSNLQVVDLGNNNLGPLFPRIPTKLVSLVLRKNNFHSGVADELSSCYQLQKMDISLNKLVGPFSPSILSLPSLTYLDIGGNKFTGKMLHNMTCGAQLKFVNLSQNRLTGDLPDCLKSTSGKRGGVVHYDGNCFSGVNRNQHPWVFCHSEALAVGITPRKREKRRYGGAVVASSMVGGIAGVVALVGVAFMFVRRKKHKVPSTRVVVDKVSSAGYTLQLLKDARYISETMRMGALGFPSYRTYVLDELKEATDNFNETSLIGEGSYGQVYKGLLTDGSVVAIRSLKAKRKYAVQTYTHQLELIARLRHCHLVSAIGHCFECQKDDSSVSRIFLVFEYVPNGTLRSFVSGGQSSVHNKFSWSQRIAAAIGVGRGIQFLHTGIVPGVYSNHLKITDILLDSDLHVKIKKYNLPLLTENRKSGGMEMVAAQSKGKFGSVEEKHDDIYDFGVMLLEMIVGRTIMCPNDVNISKDILSVSLATDDVRARRSIVDPAVHKECSDQSLKTLIELCIRCLSNHPPSIEDVIWNLQFAAQVQDTLHSNHGSPLCSLSF